MNTHPQILIVEDDAVLATELQETLTQLGYQVIGLAATGNAAIKSALAQKPDLLLMDIRLRGAMTGIQAVEQIHQQLDIPVIYLTAFADEAFLQQAKITDAYAYLVKPVRERELRAGLEMALYKHSTEKHLKHLNQILRAVRDVNQLITREHDAQRLVNEACQILLRAQGYRFVWIGQSAGDRLKPLAHAGDGQSLLTRIVASATPEQGLKLPGTEASRTRRVVVCHDMLHDKRYSPWRKEVEQVLFSSTVAIPILHEESLFGVLSVYSDQTNIFGTEEIDLLLELASDIAFGMKAIALESERQVAAESLRASEVRYRELFDNANLAIFQSTLEGKVLAVNSEFARMFGFASPAEVVAAVSNTADIFVDPKRREEIIRLKAGNPAMSEFESLYRRKDGSTFIGKLNVRQVVDANNRLLFFEGFIEDITKHRRAEDALRESEAKFRAVVENSNDGILFGDANAVIHYRSPSYNRINGFTDEERIGHSGFETAHPDDLENLRRYWVRLIEHPEISHRTEYRIRHKDGSWRWIETTGQNLLGNTDVHSVIVTSRDITERKRAEDALRENAIRYRTLLDNLPQLVWQRDLDSVFIDGNIACARTLGTTVEELAGKTDYDFYPVDLAEKYRADDRRVIENGTSETFEERFLADGNERFARTTKVPLRDDLGRLYGTLGIADDITEIKHAEEDRIAREIAEQANRAKSAFISRMSHELRTPLNAILGFSQLLKMDELKPNQMRGVEQIHKSGQHLLNLVNEVLDIARIESGKMHISPEPVRLEGTLKEALELIHPLAEARGISINLETPASSDLFVQADPQSLRQVLLNLLSNAIKYNREGGEIAITASLTIDGHLRLQVRDTGKGIPPDKMERLFVPFDRLDRDSVEQDGTGLGLALSRGLVEAMGGRIGASSQPGVGSTFWLELKLASDDGTSASRRLTEAILAEVNEHISEALRTRTNHAVVLYVEDNLDNIKLVEVIMERLSWVKLMTAMQGRLALDLAQEHQPDLILLDLHLPDMHGLEVLRRLKAQPDTQKTPVIILSADAMPEHIADLLEGGAHAYLTKPIDIQEFLKVVEESLGEAKPYG